MSLHKTDGTEIDASAFVAGETTSVVEPTQYSVTENIWEEYTPPGAQQPTRVLKFRTGQIITQADIDAAYNEELPVISVLNPNTGPAAGGTAVVIEGAKFTDSTGVTFGGIAGTAFSVEDDQTINVTTPAVAAGAADVVVQNGAGDVTLAGGFTFV